jgi:hypothetical protein
MKTSFVRFCCYLLAIFPMASLFVGCGALNQQNSGVVAIPAIQRGSVHGGSQPVSGSTIQLYAVGTTGDGSSATPLLTHAATTDANGNFTITGTYTCPTPASLVYIVATGGNPGLVAGTNNASLSLIAALGACNTLSSSTFIHISEVTTVAAVYALAPFMTSPSAVGSSPTDAQLLTDAFTLASQLVNFSTGSAPGTFVPPGYAVNIAQINTIANILATCINSAGGVAGDGSSCGHLFSLTTPPTIPPTSPPTNTSAALLLLASNPTLNTTAIYNLTSPSSPFQPQLPQAPPDLSVHLVPASGSSTFTISPASVNFPAATIGFSPPWQNITLTNNSQSSVTLSFPYNGNGAAGLNGFDFAVFNGNCYSIAPGASCTLQAAFVPTAVGSRSASYAILSTAPDSPQTVRLSGTGLAVSSNPLTASPSSVAFTQFGMPTTVTLTNYGTGTINIADINVHNGGSSSDSVNHWSQYNNCGSSLLAQSVCTVTVVANDLQANRTGASPPAVLTGSLTIVNDSSSGTLTLPLTTSSSYSASGAPLDFGNLQVGSTAQLTFTANSLNHGTEPIFSMHLSGPNASDFSLPQGPNCTPQPYPNDVICSLPIAFTPAVPGLRTANLLTTYGNVPLTGGGNGVTGTSFYVSPASLFLPPVLFPSSFGRSASVTIHNIGSTTLSFSTPTFTGPNAAMFTAPSDPCPSVAPGASCAVTVSSMPTLFGQASATITLTDTTSGMHQSIPVVITTSMSVPVPYTAPVTLNFPDTPQYQTSIPIILAVYAPNNDPVTISGNASVHAVSCTQTGTQCFSVQFAPSVVGPNSVYVNVTDTVTQAAISVLGTINGTIVGSPTLSLSSSALTFPLRPIGSTSIPQSVTLTNTGSGNAPLNFSSISLVGANSGDYILSNNCGSSLGAGGTCSISVSFSPTLVGTRTTTVQILSNAPTSPDIIQISGTAQ